MQYAWNIQSEDPPSIFEAILKNRGIPLESLEDFLAPNWEHHVESPWHFTRMREAVDRIFSALQQNQLIQIHGDYDADGVCGSSLLTVAIRELAVAMNVVPRLSVYLPDREKDGYGVAMHTVESFGKNHVNLLITVDCGIATPKEIARAKELGIDTIVCDHHQLGDELPQAILIHPLVPGETYENKFLCGTGVAWKLAVALFEEARVKGFTLAEGREKWLLDFVAVATVTDMMPLLGENRVLEHYGLQVLRKTRRPGFQIIGELARIDLRSIDTEGIGFQIGPRLNAAGRLASAEIGYRALVAETRDEARIFCEELERLNRNRQTLTSAMFEEAQLAMDAQKNAPVYVIVSEHWNPGIIGLIAGKIVNQTGRPAFVITKSNGQYVGSGRGAGGLNLVELMHAKPELFVKCGGHPEACGLTLATQEGIEAFKTHAQTFAAAFFGDREIKSTLAIDASIPFTAISDAFLLELERLAPFGQKNPKPIFHTRDVSILSTQTIGKDGKHLRLMVSHLGSACFSVIGFGMAELGAFLRLGDKIELVYELQFHEWNGKKDIQMRLLDFDVQG
ncbi:MAG: single-stranded-DNA-specific exonuclease RecJ [Patescibacteria group bacterium]|jgi:single-stranded-DNA-specific exonuclease